MYTEYSMEYAVHKGITRQNDPVPFPGFFYENNVAFFYINVSPLLDKYVALPLRVRYTIHAFRFRPWDRGWKGPEYNAASAYRNIA